MVFAFVDCYQVLAQNNEAELIEIVNEHREEKHGEFKDKESTPLNKEQLSEFEGLHYFDIDRRYNIRGKFKRTSNESSFKMKTSTDRLPEYIKYGKISFEMDGKEFSLSVYQNVALVKNKEYEDYLFIPFTDETNGDETYGGGRYIDFRIPESEDVYLNFNLCYSPYCAYNHKYSCPIPPKENDLPIKISAGEKMYQ
ncbi:MAG: hypothetical protein COC01_08140 [Bacteroidetes bacterium]|nr:DUF1684 domain-containing protein [Bacteroidia bacterium]PCH66396.1 MAG: hypothetical protein COC01_08140 [Bacteroidota bacterium]